MKIFYIFALILLQANILFSQINYEWNTLPNAPVVSRFNDVYFTSPTLGWIVNGDGQIYRTIDAGNNWVKQFENFNTHFRSVGFFDSLNGIAGNVGPGEFGTSDTILLYSTFNAGNSWVPVLNINGPKPGGICGMHVLNDSIITAVGRVRGPAFFVKTTDKGKTWTSKDMTSMAAGLIDVHFFNPDTGFVVGLSHVTHDSSSGIILSTVDGGETWDTSFISSRKGEWCWKLSFPSRNVGYVSLQRNNSGFPINIAKTTDGGKNWFEKLAFTNYYFVQGIGFVNDTLGFIGGNSSNPSYQTTDGGETWTNAGFGSRMNRVRFLSDTLGYAVGRTVYKYTAEILTSIASEEKLPENFSLSQNYPNPFNPSTKIKYQIPEAGKVKLEVFDLLGNEIKILVDEEQSAGNYEIVFTAENIPSGIYFYKLTSGNFSITKKLTFLK